MTQILQSNPKSLRIGFALTSNIRGGPQKVSAVAAADLARSGHRVEIFIPVMPYHFYLAELNKNRLRWLRSTLPYIRSWAASRKFVFQDVCDQDNARDNIKVRFVPVRPSRSQLKDLDCLVLHSVAQISEYQDRFLQSKQIYLLHHPEERTYGRDERFKAARTDFEGSIVAISPFAASEISDHVAVAAIVPDPVSATFWEQRETFDPKRPRRDVLFFWKDNPGLSEGKETLKALRSALPEMTLTVWCRTHRQAETARREFPSANVVENVPEDVLRGLYLTHSFFLFPYTYEGFGMPPIEGLACGCIPLLLPNVGAAGMYAKDGGNAIFLDRPNHEVAERISQLLNYPKKLESIRRLAPNSIGQFNPEGYGHRLLHAGGFLP